MPVFKTREWLKKRAYYEGAQGYFQAQQRAWMNCSKCKLDAGMGAQEAWESCLEEFQKGDQKLEWVGQYAGGGVKEAIEKKAQMEGAQPQMPAYWDKIKAHMETGMTPGQAVMEALKECTVDAESIGLA